MTHESPQEGINVKRVNCPTCRGDSLYTPSNPYRPFCSARCKNQDFGAWASESFRMEAAPAQGEETEFATAPIPALGKVIPH